ncbi:splicing factor 3B subunit 4-like [Selaginella moellendorffii]|uniref:splicing factor 3B subunit 4-like n=1 Tax=Selaginella moellendorffii TaxID=88036 RepID=UPI000D1CD7A3|nr:splicing factor 3B subunit 4-like [Selaginella moellendorffii]|eukprot:XP_024526377.1 splicing factor 3B subunit 4-like [Selaginella moellendorffii]
MSSPTVAAQKNLLVATLVLLLVAISSGNTNSKSPVSKGRMFRQDYPDVDPSPRSWVPVRPGKVSYKRLVPSPPPPPKSSLSPPPAPSPLPEPQGRRRTKRTLPSSRN